VGKLGRRNFLLHVPHANKYVIMHESSYTYAKIFDSKIYQAKRGRKQSHGSAAEKG
jgi:hypothetical protein